MGDINLISIVHNDTNDQAARTVSQTMSSNSVQNTGVTSTIDDSFNFSEALDSPCMAAMSYFEEPLHGMPRQISPPIGRMNQPSAASCLPQGHSSLSAHVSPCNCTKPSSVSGKTDSGFSSWNGTSESRRKAFFPAKTSSERNLRSDFPFSPDPIAFDHDSNVTHSLVRSGGQQCSEDSSEQSFGMLSCAHTLDEEFTDRMLMKRLSKIMLNMPNKSSTHLVDSHLGNHHLPVSSSPVVRVPDSSLPPCCFVTYEPGGNVRATGAVSPHWLLEPIIPDCRTTGCYTHPKSEVAPNHSGGPLRDEGAPVHFQVERCAVDTDVDGDDESELIAINQINNMGSSPGCRLHPTHHCHSIESHSQLPVKREDTSTPSQHLRATNPCQHTVREPLWMRRSRPPEAIYLDSSLSRSSRYVNTSPHAPESTGGTIGVTSPNSPSQCHRFQPSSIPDVVPRHMCSLRVPPLAATGLPPFTTLHCFSSGSYLQPRCSSVPLVPSSPCHTVLDCTFGCTHFFSHRLRTGRASHSFSMQSPGGVGVSSDPHRHHHLSILARRMADIGDELEADYQGPRQSALVTGNLHGTQPVRRTNDSLWSLSSSLASLVTVPFDCVQRIFQLAGRSLSGTSLQMPESPTQRTSRVHIPTRRCRTTTFNSTGSGRYRYTASHGQMSETLDLITSNSRPPRTALVHVPSRARETWHRLPASVPLDRGTSPQLRIAQESIGSRQPADEIFSFDH